MKLEIWEARGLRLAIDGVSHDGPWEVGEAESGWTVSAYDDDGIAQPLQIGQYQIVEVTLDKPPDEVCMGGEETYPKQVKLVTADSSWPIELRVVTVASECRITTVSGKKETIDEITLYIRAQTADDIDQPPPVEPWDGEMPDEDG